MRLLGFFSANVELFGETSQNVRESPPSGISSGVMLSDQSTWPQHRCLILYCPPKTNSRAIQDWFSRHGYSTTMLSSDETDDPVIDSPWLESDSVTYDSQVFTGHADIFSVRGAFASRGLRCLEWSHLREPSQRIVSQCFPHGAHA